MANNYTFLDAYSSVRTALATDTGGVLRPTVDIASVIGTVPVTFSGASSVSGTVGASVIGLTPVAVTNTPSVSGTVLVGNNLVASIAGTVQVSGNPSISGTVLVNNGSVVAFQGTSPWVTTFTTIPSISGTVNTVWTSPSIVGTYAEDAAHTSADKGLFTLGVRNDAVASFAAANLEYTPFGLDPAGRVLTKPFAAVEAAVSGVSSVTSSSVTSILPAPGAGLKNYVTDILVANTGSVLSQVTFRDADASIIGRTIAPAGSGSNIKLTFPMKTGGANQQVDYIAGTPVSILSVSMYGFKAP